MGNEILDRLFSTSQRSGRTFDIYLSFEAMRLEGKKVLIHTHYPEWMTEFMDKLDMTRHGRKLGNYEIADMTINGEGVDREFITEISEIDQFDPPH